MNRFNLILICIILALCIVSIFSISSCSRNKNHAGELSYEKAMLVIDTATYRDNLGRVHKVVNQFTTDRNTLLSSNIELLNKNKLLFNMAEYYKNLVKNKNTGTLVGATIQTTGSINVPTPPKNDSGAISVSFNDNYLTGTYVEYSGQSILEYSTADTLLGSINNKVKEPILTWHPFKIKLFNRSVHYTGDFTLKNPRSRLNDVIITDVIK